MMVEALVRLGKLLNRGVVVIILAATYIVLIGAYALPMRLFARRSKAAWQPGAELGDFHSPY